MAESSITYKQEVGNLRRLTGYARKVFWLIIAIGNAILLTIFAYSFVDGGVMLSRLLVP